MNRKILLCVLVFSLCVLIFFPVAGSGLFSGTQEDQKLDERVRDFLDSRRYSWRDMNVPESDGKVLYDIIIKNNYTKALE
ncbi:MAG: hypothetical protein KAT69_03615, partial [Candidatus Aminicenantes bacterium]|nr:hypothetical protein [Candidatus Aminicenantes bacterium]